MSDRYCVLSDNHISGPYAREQAAALAGHVQGTIVPFEIVRHCAILYHRLTSVELLLKDVQQAVADTLAHTRSD